MLKIGAVIAAFQILVVSVAWAMPDQFQSFDLIQDKKISLATKSAEKKGLVLVFMSAKCPCSNSHVPELKALAEKYKDFRFVAVHSNSDEDLKSAKSYFQSAQLPFPVLEDSKDLIADELKAYKTPHAFVLGPQGDILYQGGVTSSAIATQADRHYLDEVLEDISQGKKPRLSRGRTLGCVIMRGDKKNVW
ncbi:MAG: thioredoxin family protein [Bdellovibrio sp. CG10_big_fil_rev_8_21_14_0_10_47_8]|nr:MAG: thioredoxin family protein [Bdellovibrio sp. CG10_big_fil_rev_8_21_14_0_10_47_8]